MQLLINGFMVEADFDEQTVEGIFRPLLQHLCVIQQQKDGRLIAFVAAPPATGKSTLAAFLQQLAGQMGITSFQALGMDGFHYPQSYIAAHTVMRDGREIPMQRVKGAPESFDVMKLKKALEALAGGGSVPWPIYDRTLHDSVDNALCAQADIVLVEGNYLLLDDDIWRDLPHDFSIFIEAEEAQLRDRLIERKMRGGASREQALAHYESADGPNVRLTMEKRMPADITLIMKNEGRFEKKE